MTPTEQDKELDLFSEEALKIAEALYQIFKALYKQQDIIYRLSDRLRPVSSPQPRNETVSGQLIGEGQIPHLSQAGEIARRNNDELNYIIDTLLI